MLQCMFTKFTQIIQIIYVFGVSWSVMIDSPLQTYVDSSQY